MKKFVALLLTMIMLLSCTGIVAQAKVGDVVGTALHTDIVVYINNYAVPSYAVNGTSVIVAEDLANFGFDVIWDGNSRSLHIRRNSDFDVYPMFVSKGYTTGTKYTNILSTDISVWAAGKRITSYAMNGFTMIPVEELEMFGELYWDPSQRTLKLWVDDLDYLDEMQYVAHRYYPGTSVPDYGWITETICYSGEDQTDGTRIRMYLSDYSDVEKYINYIKSQGFTLSLATYDEDGYYEGYVNKSLRQGVLVQDTYDMGVFVQIEDSIDNWVE
ncbi:MAG: hypothetical protein IKB50_01055 [Clostridia bacterium]|nr:hypothetical protein [Clostridia bacterium]